MCGGVAENFRPLQAVVRVAGVSGAHYKRVLSFERRLSQAAPVQEENQQSDAMGKECL